MAVAINTIRKMTHHQTVVVVVGVLALQGGFAEHVQALRKCGVEAKEVRLPQDLTTLDALILPGGESTTIGLLATTYGLIDAIRIFALDHPVWGSCAGAILLSKGATQEGKQSDQPLIGAMNLTVSRNAFGSQVDSFEFLLTVHGIEHLDQPFPAVFIRAPVLVPGPSVSILASLPDGKVVACQQGHLLATSFHPELAADLRMHRFFNRLISHPHQ